MIDEIQSAIKLINEQENLNMMDIRKTLGLPEWFDSRTCTLLIPTHFKHLFKQDISWIRFCQYIPKDKMFALKNDLESISKGTMAYVP